MFKAIYKITHLTALLLALSLMGSGLQAQNMINANPANMDDFRSAFVNPAIFSFQSAHAVAGAKLFHLGFIDDQTTPFRQGYAGLALPFGVNDLTGFGIQAQYFNTPLFSQSNLSLGFSRRINRIYSFGLKLNLFSKSFNQDNFDLVDENDPVFANGTAVWNATLGAGFAMILHPNLMLGLGLDHLNRANISLNGDDVYQPLKGYLGAYLDLGFLQASVSVAYENGKYLPRTSIGSAVSKLGYFRVGYGDRAAEFEGQFRVTGPLSLNYSYDYTLFDNQGIGHGSHQFSLIHEFGKKDDLPELDIPQELLLDFKRPSRTMDLSSRFYVYSSVDRVQIIEKRLQRVIDPGVSKDALAQLSLYDVGLLDTTKTEYLPFTKDTMDVSLIPTDLNVNLSDDYKKYVEQVSEDLKDKRNIPATIVTSKKALLRAAGLRKYFGSDSSRVREVAVVEPAYHSLDDSLKAHEKVGDRALKPQETFTSLSQNSTQFRIVPILLKRPTVKWNLVIEDANGREIRKLSGDGLPPEQVSWDWKDTSGKLIAPGVYYYFLAWRDENNERGSSDKRPIFAQKIQRNITIEITNKPQKIGDDVDEVDLILKD